MNGWQQIAIVVAAAIGGMFLGAERSWRGFALSAPFILAAYAMLDTWS